MEKIKADKYDASASYKNGYSLAHGTAIDFELWEPQSVEYKRQKDVALRQVKGGLLPLLRIKVYHGELLNSGVMMRCETDSNLSELFWADAACRELDLGHELQDARIRRRADARLAKYLVALNERLSV